MKSELIREEIINKVNETGKDNLFIYTIKQIKDYEKKCGYIDI